MCSRFYQWYTNIVQGSSNGTIGNTIGTNGNANGTIGYIGKPMVPLGTNGTIGKIINGTIGRTPNRAITFLVLLLLLYRRGPPLIYSRHPVKLAIMDKRLLISLYKVYVTG